MMVNIDLLFPVMEVSELNGACLLDHMDISEDMNSRVNGHSRSITENDRYPYIANRGKANTPFSWTGIDCTTGTITIDMSDYLQTTGSSIQSPSGILIFDPSTTCSGFITY